MALLLTNNASIGQFVKKTKNWSVVSHVCSKCRKLVSLSRRPIDLSLMQINSFRSSATLYLTRCSTIWFDGSPFRKYDLNCMWLSVVFTMYWIKHPVGSCLHSNRFTSLSHGVSRWWEKRTDGKARWKFSRNTPVITHVAKDPST